LIAHLDYRTEGFKVPMIFNSWFERKGIHAIVMPLEAGIEVVMMRPKR
jgi:shikimate dehydrogenase